MKEIFSVNSQHANGKKKYSCKKKFDELGRDCVSLDTGFLATVVKNLWVVLSFNARKAIRHNTKMINNVAKAILTIYNEMTACEV